MALSAQDRGVLQQGVDSLTQHIAGLGLGLSIEQDFTGLVALLSRSGAFTNPSYDPAHSRLGWRDFWVRLAESDGRTIACSAEKVVETEDFMQLVADGRIWYAGGYTAIGQGPLIPVLRHSREINGTVSHSGSTWVHPDWRGRGLAMLMVRLTQALSFRNSAAAINTGFVRESLLRGSVPTLSYGYVRVELCIDGWWPPQRSNERLYLCSITDQEYARSVEQLPRHPHTPVRLVDLPQPVPG